MTKNTEYSLERKRRISKLARWLEKNEFDAALFVREEIELLDCNYLYYGGAKLSSEYGAMVVDSAGECTAIAHEYSFERVKASGEYSKVYEIRQSMSELAGALRRINADYPRLVVDSSTSASTVNLLKAGKIKLRENSLREFVFHERSIKSNYEVSEIETAIRVAAKAFEKIVGALKAGISTEGITLLLNKAMLDEGAVHTSFETDIRIRRNLGEAEETKLSEGDLVLFDFGARLPSMYLSDVGRTIPFGGSNEKTRDFLDQVCSIKGEGLRKIASGKSGARVREDIDQVIKEHGFESTHRPGHQIGLNVHEPYGPHLNFGKENSSTLKAGNVVTWEPGIGVASNQPKNRFGMAHMEDMVLVGTHSKILGDFKLQFW